MNRALFVAALLSLPLAGLGLACSSSSGSSSDTTDSGGAGSDGSGGEGGASEASPGMDANGSDVTVTGDSGNSADSGTAVDTGSSSTDSSTAGDTSTPPADSGSAGDGGPGDAGAVDANCGAIPTLHMDPAGSVYCGYGVDGGSLVCGTGQECCLGGAIGVNTYAPDECAATGTSCTNGGTADAGGSAAIPIACQQIADCTADGVAATACCLQGATAPAPAPGCTYPRSRSGSAIVCEGTGTGPTACAAGEVNICSSQADCPSGTTCTAGKWKIFQVGFCL